MQKGKFGICLWFYAALAFLLAFLGQILLSGILLGFVILAERDEWLTKQVMQAFLLCVGISLINTAVDLLNIFAWVPLLSVVFGWVFRVIHWAVAVIALIFVIIGCVRTAKGLDAGIPLASLVSDRAFGYIKQKVAYQAYPTGYAAPGAPQQPGYSAPQQPGYSAPQQPGYSAPQQPGYSAPQQPGYSAPQQPGYPAPQQPDYPAPQAAQAAQGVPPAPPSPPVPPQQPPQV